MNSLELTEAQLREGYRPLAGRVMLRMDRPPEMVGSIHVPETAQRQTKERDRLLIGTVLAIGFGAFLDGPELLPGIREGDVAVGDRVLVEPLLMDLNKAVLLTAVTRVVAVLEG